jgi:hypothetical protein
MIDEDALEGQAIATFRKAQAAIFVNRACPQRIVRDPDGKFWLVPSVEKPWDHRQPFQPTEQTDLEPIPGHYGDMGSCQNNLIRLS